MSVRHLTRSGFCAAVIVLVAAMAGPTTTASAQPGIDEPAPADTAPEVPQPPMPDPAPSPPTGDGPDGELADPPQFPEGPFAYDAEHLAVWQQICGPGGWLEQIQGDAEALVEWYTLIESDPNYDCGQEYLADASPLAAAMGGDVFADGIPISKMADCNVDAGAWNHLDRKGFAFACQTTLDINVMITGLSIKIIDWAFDFDVSTTFAPTSQSIASGYFWSLVGGGTGTWVNNAYMLALFATTVWAAIKALRGGLARAVGEWGFSFLLLVGFWASIATTPTGFSDITANALGAANSIGAAVADVTLASSSAADACLGYAPAQGPVGPGGPPRAVDLDNFADVSVICPLANGLTDALIKRPYDLVNWGRDLGDSDVCAVARNEVLATGPHGSDDQPRWIMGAVGCDGEAAYNHDPSSGRLGIAVGALIVSVFVLILIVLLAFTLLIAQLTLVVIVIVFPFVMLAGVLPGGGRFLLWKWVESLLKGVLAVVAIAGILAFQLTSLDVMMAVTENAPWAVQAGSMLLVTIGMFFLRNRIVKGASAGAAALASNLAAFRPGSGGGLGGASSMGAFAGGFSRQAHDLYDVGTAYQASATVRDAPARAGEIRQNHLDRKAHRSSGYTPRHGVPAPAVTSRSRYRKQRTARNRARAAARRRYLAGQP